MVKATDAVWAEAEAWVEAEFRAEENAWKELEEISLIDQLSGMWRANESVVDY